MALINCPECGRENISDSIVACPSYGYGIKEHFEKIKKEKALIEKQNKERESIRMQLEHSLRGIDNMARPDKPSWIDISIENNNWIFYVLLICTIIFIGLSFFTGSLSLGPLIFAIPTGVITYLGFQNIKSDYDIALSKYNNWDSYKENLKQQAKDNYKFQLNNLTKPQNTSASNQVITPQPSYGLRCPVCGSSNIKRISNTSRVISIAIIGLASSKIGKQYECRNCKHKW